MKWRIFMGKVKMTKAERKRDAHYYLSKLDLDPRFSDYCLNREDVDIIRHCVKLVEASRFTYLKAKHDAPHNVTANINARTRFYDDESVPETMDSEAYLRELYPLRSNTKDTKKEALELPVSILKKNGFGKERLEGIVPILTYILMDEEEEFKENRQIANQWEDFIK
jgi:hypothetical protein